MIIIILPSGRIFYIWTNARYEKDMHAPALQRYDGFVFLFR